MIRCGSPMWSLSAWGHFPYPFPVGMWHTFYPTPHFLPSIYPLYDYRGWVYERRRTWHGIQPIARRFAYPTNRRTPVQQENRYRFGSAVSAWQLLDSAQKAVWNVYKYPPEMSGYNRFLRCYMLGRI